MTNTTRKTTKPREIYFTRILDNDYDLYINNSHAGHLRKVSEIWTLTFTNNKHRGIIHLPCSTIEDALNHATSCVNYWADAGLFDYWLAGVGRVKV